MLSAAADGGPLDLYGADEDVVAVPGDGAAVVPSGASLVLEQPSVEPFADAGQLELVTGDVQRPKGHAPARATDWSAVLWKVLRPGRRGRGGRGLTGRSRRFRVDQDVDVTGVEASDALEVGGHAAEERLSRGYA